MRITGTELLLAAFLFASGCTLAKVDVNVVSERTSLENQVLGSYNRISDDVMLVASVRGISPSGKVETRAPRSPEQEDALSAVETIAFHADDIYSFKRLGWIGENRDGLLEMFDRKTVTQVPADLKSFVNLYSEEEFRQVVSEVNSSRETLMKRVVQTNDRFTSKDLPAIRGVFAKMNIEKSPSGTRYQNNDGSWSQVKR